MNTPNTTLLDLLEKLHLSFSAPLSYNEIKNICTDLAMDWKQRRMIKQDPFTNEFIIEEFEDGFNPDVMGLIPLVFQVGFNTPYVISIRHMIPDNHFCHTRKYGTITYTGEFEANNNDGIPDIGFRYQFTPSDGGDPN